MKKFLYGFLLSLLTLPVLAQNLGGTFTGNGIVNGSGLTAGSAYAMVSGTLTLAEANTAQPALCIAISSTQCAYSGLYTTTGLTANAPYYLSPTTAGAITTTLPVLAGQYVQSIGVALSTTKFWIAPASASVPATPDAIRGVGGGGGLDARAYGVVGDGSTDNNAGGTGSLYNAINTVCGSSAYSHNIWLPPGKVVFGTGMTIPSTCLDLQFNGPGSGGRTGSLTNSSGRTLLSYTGNGTAITLGTEATPARTTITSISRNGSNVVTVVAQYNATLAAMTTADQIMVRGVTPTDLDTEAVYVASVATDGSTEVTLTYNSTGSTETGTLSSAYVDYAWNDNTYYANAASGFSMNNINLSCDSTTRTQLSNYQSYTDSSPDTGSNHQTYATTAVGIQSWRAPNQAFNYVQISGCYQGFFGTNSDEDTFNHMRVMNNETGIWASSQNSQVEFDDGYSSGNDVAILLDGVLKATFRGWTFDTDGSASTSGLTVWGNQLARPTTGVQCYDCWFENNHGSTITAIKSFVSLGENGASTVIGMDFYNPVFSTPVVPTSSAPQTTSFTTIGNADQIHIYYPVDINHPQSNIQPSPFLEFTGSYSPQDVLVMTGLQTLTTLSGNSGTGTPKVVWLKTGGGTISNASINGAPIYTYTAHNVVNLPTTAIAAGTCSLIPGSAWTVSGVTTSSHIGWSWAGDPGGTDGQLVPALSATSSGTVIGRICNPTATSITPTTQAINWWIQP